jgi:cysteinyl-tRNA synthetase
MDSYKQKFIEAMEDDINTANAISAIFEAVRFINGEDNLTTGSIKYASELICEIGGVLGLLKNRKKENLDSEIEKLIEERQEARKAKNFARADEIRDSLKAQGIILEDTPSGVKWRRA